MNQCYSSLIAWVRLNPGNVALQLRPLPLGLVLPVPPVLIDNYQKARIIVDHMKDSVMGNPLIFDVFLKALEDAGSWTRLIVSELKQTRSNLQHSGKLASRAREVYVAITIFLTTIV